MKRKAYTLILLLSANLALSQEQKSIITYTHTDGNNPILVRDLIETSDGHLVAGYDQMQEGTSPVSGIMKTDMEGGIIWSKTLDIPDSFEDCVFEIAENNHGDYYLWGLSRESTGGNLRAILSEISPEGEMNWSKAYDFGLHTVPEYAVNQLQVLPSGDLQMMISVYGQTILMKINSEGDIIWGKISHTGEPWGGELGGKSPGFEWLVIPGDGGVCSGKLGGYFSLMRYSEEGELLWNRIYQLGGYTHGKTIAKSTNGNILIGGFIDSSPHIMELDYETGDINWIKKFEDILMNPFSNADLNVVNDEIIFDFTTPHNVFSTCEHYVVKIAEDGTVLQTLVGKYNFSDYNKIEFGEDSQYAYGTVEVDDQQQGFIEITEDIFAGSCYFEITDPLTISDYESVTEIDFDIVIEDFISEDDMTIGLTDNSLETESFCSIFLSTSEESVHKLDIYPNPASNNLTISVSNELINATYTLTDLSGKTIAKNTITSGQTQIDLSELNQGQYILTIQNADQIITEKVSLIK